MNTIEISSKLYEGQQDLQTILDLTPKIRPVAHLHDYPVKVDIEESLSSATVRANTRLWFINDQPVAWAYVDLFNNLRWEVQSELEETLGTEIVEWGEDCIRRTLSQGETATLDVSCREDYIEKIHFLRKHGFSQTNDVTVHLQRSLCDPIPTPVLPDGFVIRPLAGEEEAEAVAAMHRTAFGTVYMTTESRLEIMRTSEYDRSLDLVVVDPNGLIVGNCICSVRENKAGFTDPISVHPGFQGMGLARALLLTGMVLLKQRGMEFAQLGTSGGNISMQKTAESVGYAVEHRIIWFCKLVR